MFVILTSRPGQYRTELGDGLQACESYDYLFCGQRKARFVIASLLRDVKIRVIDEAPPEQINDIPCKFLQKFATIEDARGQLECLTSFGGMDTALRKLP
ncbi:MAG: hypothetical protein ABSC95_12095 [Acetobacteraceae bacterium]|jgi:hypothetical protein